MAKKVEKTIEDAAKALLREILRRIREIMRQEYGVSNVSIKPIGGEGSRLSIPCKVSGNKGEERVHYFAKIIGTSDFVSSLSIQFIKNIYLQMNAKDPLFDSPTSAEEMAKFQFEMLKALHRIAVPSPKPFGYHAIDEIRWLLVAEFIDAKPISTVKAGPEVMDTAFAHLRKLHDNKVFHADIKPDNLMLGDKLYIVDVGRFRDGVPERQKKAYDLACMICSFLNDNEAEVIVATAQRHFSPGVMKEASEYVGFVQRRPDFYFTDDMANKLRRLLKK